MRWIQCVTSWSNEMPRWITIFSRSPNGVQCLQCPLLYWAQLWSPQRINFVSPKMRDRKLINLCVVLAFRVFTEFVCIALVAFTFATGCWNFIETWKQILIHRPSLNRNNFFNPTNECNWKRRRIVSPTNRTPSTEHILHNNNNDNNNNNNSLALFSCSAALLFREIVEKSVRFTNDMNCLDKINAIIEPILASLTPTC